MLGFGGACVVPTGPAAYVEPMNVDWVTLFCSIDIPWLEKVVRTVVIYLGIAILIRLAGKRLMAQMNSLDLVVVLLLSNVVQNAIIGQDNSLVGGLLGAVVLVLVNAGLDRLAQLHPPLHAVIEGRSTDVITDGEVDEPALSRLGMTKDELLIGLGRQGADEPNEVARGTLTPGGDLLVDLKKGERSATHDELEQAVAELKAHIDAVLSSRGR